MRIAFVSPKRYSFYPHDYQGRGLGGTESALVLLSRSLAARGHRVSVYNCCYRPGVYDHVRWAPLWSFIDSGYDVIISLRLLETFKTRLKAPVRAVWIHDESLVGASDADRAGLVNLWIAVSATQRSFIERGEVIVPSHWFVSRNGVDAQLYGRGESVEPKVPGQCIYCSAPERGLSHLLKMWPKIVSRVPTARLKVTGSWALWGNADEENRRIFSDLYRRASKLRSVEILERVPKERLVQLQRQSELMLYPADFDEMFCISALECLASGTPIISSRRAAMVERVKSGRTGFLIPGRPKNPSFQRRFIDTTVELLGDGERRRRFAAAAISSTEYATYDDIAKEWEKEFTSQLRR